MKARYKMFRGTFKAWDTLFQEACEFASNLGKDKVISISHSSDHSDGIVTVWYWD